MTLEERMVNYRARHDLSMQDAAKRCGISMQTWRYVEKGMQSATPLTEAKIKLLVDEEEKK